MPAIECAPANTPWCATTTSSFVRDASAVVNSDHLKSDGVTIDDAHRHRPHEVTATPTVLTYFWSGQRR